jgi:PAP2 superfamily
MGCCLSSVATNPGLAASLETHSRTGLLRAALRREFDEHRILLALALAYVVLGGCVLSWSLDGAVETLATNFPLIIAGNGVIIASVSAIWTTGYLIKTRPAHPFSAVARAFGQPDIWPTALARALILVPAMALVTGTFSAIKAEIPTLQPFVYDPLFVHIDAALHGGWQPWQLLQPILGHPFITNGLDRIYYLWFAVLYHTLYWQVFTLKRPLLRMQFIAAFLLSWMLIGTVAAITLSSAGPVFLGGLGLDGSAFTGLFDYLHSVDAQRPVFALTVQDMLWRAYAEGADVPLKGISAMPSMHVAIAVLLAIFGWRRHWLLGVGYTAFAILIFLGSIHFGFHYAVDGYVAALMVAAIWVASGRLARRSLRTSSADSA